MGRPPHSRRHRLAPPVVPVVAVVGLTVLASLVLAFPILGATASGTVSARSGISAPGTTVQIAPAYMPAPGVRDLGPLAGDAPVQVAVGLAPSNLAGLEGTAQAVNTPGSPEYRSFLTPAEIGQRFGPSSETMAAARAYFQEHGLTVSGSNEGFLLVVSGPARSVSAAFHTSFDLYRDGPRTFYSHPTPATLPGGVAWTGAVGLGNASEIRPASIYPTGAPISSVGVHPAAGCAVQQQYITPCVMHIAYDYSSLIAAGTNGTGSRIGIVDAYDSAAPQPQLARDFVNFTKTYGLPSGDITFAYPIPNGNLYNTTTSDGWGLEDTLDPQWARAAAPGAAITFALSTATNAGIYGAVDWLVTQGNVQAISLSWGEPDVGIYNAAVMPCPSACNASSDGSYGLLHPVIMAAAAEGITVLAASGDCGSAGGTSGVSTNYPSSDPWTLGVGGTALTYNTVSGAWVSETAWSGNSSGAVGSGCTNGGGSGGGFAPFPRPYWQTGTGLDPNGTERGVPDVSLNAATPTVIIFRGLPATIGGTSLATPIWAGIVAVGDQLAGKSLGFVDPSLYSVLRSPEYAAALHDIVQGSNGFAATLGWDPVTGIGTPQVAVLLPLLARPPTVPTDLFARLTASALSGAAPLTVTFTAHVTGGAPPYAIYNFVYGDGNATLKGGATDGYTYLLPGVYAATVVVFDSGSNSSVAAPIVIVVGGGAPLPLALAASAATGAVGSSITFRANVTGGVAPYTFQIWFGDGTSSQSVTQRGASFVATRSFGAPGGYCAVASVSDAEIPVHGGGSLPVAIAIGNGSRPICQTGPAINATFTANRTAADLPGDLPLRIGANGGQAPLTTWLAATDPYVSACQCGIFRTVGPQTLQLYANDSLGNRSVLDLNVTIYPALAATFAASVMGGPAPLAVTFTAAVRGGHLADANTTAWSFGDGNGSVGASTTYTYTRPGEYVAIGSIDDAGGGNASEAFLIDVTPATGAGLGVTGTITPAVRTFVGEPIYLNTTGVGGSGGYTYRWDLADGSSGFGPALATTVNPAACPSVFVCALGLNVTVADATGATFTLPITLDPFFSGAASVLGVHLTPGPAAGTTAFRFTSSVVAVGLPALQVHWSFGDGGTASGQTVKHFFLRPGNFTVRANVTDPAGDLWTVSQAVAVNGSVIAPLSLRLTAANLTCVAPCTFHLAANVTGGFAPYNITWFAGNGTSATGPILNLSSTTPGVLNVSATAVDALGENATGLLALTTFALTHVNVSFSASPTTLDAGQTFTATIVLHPFCVAWSVANCTTAPIPATLYELEPGTPHAPLLGQGLGGLVPGKSYTLQERAAAVTGTLPFQVEVLGPYYAGNAVVVFQVHAAAPATNYPSAALGLILLGTVVGIATAVAVLLYERGRPRTPAKPPAAPPAGAVAPPPWTEPPPPRPPATP